MAEPGLWRSALALDVSVRLQLSAFVQCCFLFHCLSSPTNFFEKYVKAFPNVVSIIMLFWLCMCLVNFIWNTRKRFTKDEMLTQKLLVLYFIGSVFTMLPRVTSDLWVSRVLGSQVSHQAWLSMLFFVETKIYLRVLISVTNWASYKSFKSSETGVKWVLTPW